MKWFRLHSEFANDPKLKTFSQAHRYCLICLMCLANESKERGTITLDTEDVAAVLDMNEDEYVAFVAKLEKKGIVSCREDGAITFINWTARQYDRPSDAPEEAARRKQKQRENERQKSARGVTNADEEDVSRESHAKVTRGHDTYSDSESDSEADSEIPPTPPRGGSASAPRAPASPPAGAKATGEARPKEKFRPPEISEIVAFMASVDGVELATVPGGVRSGIEHEAAKCLAYYESVGWRKRAGPIVDWRAAVRTWLGNRAQYAAVPARNGHSPPQAREARSGTPPGMGSLQEQMAGMMERIEGRQALMGTAKTGETRDGWSGAGRDADDPGE